MEAAIFSSVPTEKQAGQCCPITELLLAPSKWRSEESVTMEMAKM